MNILPLHKDIEKYLDTRGLRKKFEKQIALFQVNVFHPSLNTELLEPHDMKIWSFRIDLKYRALFIFSDPDTVEIIEVTNHYS
jgi:Txe/YoeB family toxin of Txe-Axe toxin-antitoxin module